MTKVAIIGAGPAGCMVACNLDKDLEVTLFDKNSPLKTLLPTGGGRCNLANAEYDFRELAKNYPRGEKFLYSVFSRFSTTDTLDFFENIGVKTYTQDDNRIFPISNSAKEVREKILANLKHCKFVKEEVVDIKRLDNGFKVKTNKAEYLFDIVVLSIGGKGNYNLAKKLGHTIIDPKPALVGLNTTPNYPQMQGICIKNCKIISEKTILEGDILFTNHGITGPAIFKLSSINARKEMPYKIIIKFLNRDIDFQKVFDTNSHKDLRNILSDFLPKNFINTVLKDIDLTQKGYSIKSNTKELVKKLLTSHEFYINGTKKDGETVISGGISTDEIESKTLKSKILDNLYFCGEILNIDGYCGGFNLQNCWSTGYITAKSINSTSF